MNRFSGKKKLKFLLFITVINNQLQKTMLHKVIQKEFVLGENVSV